MSETKEINQLARTVAAVLMSPAESDRNLEPANVVDGLYALARAVDRLAAATEQANQRTDQP